MFYPALQDFINEKIEQDSKYNLHLLIERSVKDWLSSTERLQMLEGEAYYLNKTDIQNKKVALESRANTKLENGFVRKLVDQKTGYLLSKPPSISSSNGKHDEILKNMLDKSFLRILKNVGKDAINKGIAWLQIYINEEGELAFKRLPAEEIIPLWADIEHTKLTSVIRVYTVVEYKEEKKKEVIKVEYWDDKGVKYFVYEGGKITKDYNQEINCHFMYKDKPYNFNRVPFVAFKYNDEEQPLIGLIKTLVDEYNYQSSVYADMLRDLPNVIYILKNAGGTDLDKFIYQLGSYGVAGLMGDEGLETLRGDPNTQAVESILEQLRENIIEFGRGVDFTNLNIGNATGVGLKFRYSDLDMDANILETEIQSSFEGLLWFINIYLELKGEGDFSKEKVELVLNRDIIISESDAIEDCVKSMGVISIETILANHPWVENVLEEIARKAKEENSQKKPEDEYDYVGESHE